MKRITDRDKKIEETLNSLDYMQRAEPAPFFYTRVQARMRKQTNRQDAWETLSSFFTRPAIVITSILLVIALNAAVVYREMPARPAFTEQTEQIADEEYNLGVASIYEYENQER